MVRSRQGVLECRAPPDDLFSPVAVWAIGVGVGVGIGVPVIMYLSFKLGYRMGIRKLTRATRPGALDNEDKGHAQELQITAHGKTAPFDAI